MECCTSVWDPRDVVVFEIGVTVTVTVRGMDVLANETVGFATGQ